MKRFILLLLIAAVCFCSGCGTDFVIGDDTVSSQSDDKTVFIIGYNFEGTNPLLVKNNANREIFSLIYDSLFTLDEDYMPQGNIAKNIAMTSEDGLNYRIDLNDNILFHDGVSLTSSDVVATFNYLLSNNTAYDYNIKSVAGVSVNTPYSVNVTLKEPVVNPAALFTFPIVNSKDILKEFSFNGTGMFAVANYVSKKYIDLVINENYHGEKNTEIKKIKVQLMPDKETANYAYSSGMADVYTQDIFTDVNSVNPKSGSEKKEYLSMNYSFLLINHSNPLFESKNVRKAISLAIDKDSIVTDVLFSHGLKVATPIIPSAWCGNENLSSTYDVEEAKRILKEEGYTPNVNTGILEKEGIALSFGILVNNDNNFRIQVANKISENLKYVGIDCKVQIVSFEEYSLSYYEKSYEAFLGTVPMSGDFDLKLFMGEGNVSNYESPVALNELLNLSLTDSYEKKKECFFKLQEIFYEDLPHISLYYTKESIQSSAKIKSGLNPTGANIFNDIEKWSFNE